MFVEIHPLEFNISICKGKKFVELTKILNDKLVDLTNILPNLFYITLLYILKRCKTILDLHCVCVSTEMQKTKKTPANHSWLQKFSIIQRL